MIRRLLDYWLTYWTSVLTIIFAFAYVKETRISITLINDALNIPGWLIILAFLISTVVNALTRRLNWRYHVLILSPFIVYGFLSIVAYAITAQSIITGILSGHLYGGITVTFIFFVALKQDNQLLRAEQEALVNQIEKYKNDLGWNE